MSLKGFTRNCTRRNGGIRRIWIADAAEIASVEVSQGVATGVGMTGTAYFAAYDFEEESASYSEEATLTAGTLAVEHTLTFSLGKVGRDSAEALAELEDSSQDGMVAVVETNCGERLLVGYSTQFGTERALKLSAGTAVTGRRLKETSSTSVKLYSCDTSGALPFEGTLPVAP